MYRTFSKTCEWLNYSVSCLKIVHSTKICIGHYLRVIVFFGAEQERTTAGADVISASRQPLAVRTSAAVNIRSRAKNAQSRRSYLCVCFHRLNQSRTVNSPLYWLLSTRDYFSWCSKRQNDNERRDGALLFLSPTRSQRFARQLLWTLVNRPFMEVDIQGERAILTDEEWIHRLTLFSNQTRPAHCTSDTFQVGFQGQNLVSTKSKRRKSTDIISALETRRYSHKMTH